MKILYIFTIFNLATYLNGAKEGRRQTEALSFTAMTTSLGYTFAIATAMVCFLCLFKPRLAGHHTLLSNGILQCENLEMAYSHKTAPRKKGSAHRSITRNTGQTYYAEKNTASHQWRGKRKDMRILNK